MVYLVNTIFIGALALAWNRDGWTNLFIKFALGGIALLNAIGAYPTFSQIVKF